MAGPSYAVVFKTHVWDGFIARQLARYVASAKGGDVFVYVDETNGRVPPIDHDRVIRADNADLFALGLADRAERGSLIWWNTDYPHYLFRSMFPRYDYYVFVEYDTCVQRDLDGLIADVARAGADLVGLPTRTAKRDWAWTPYHLATYDYETLTGSLNCISVQSNRALRLLARRRLEMSDGPERVAYWPGNEVFLATEVTRAGMTMMSLEAFGDATGFEWYPPHLEDKLGELGHLTFLHPVLDAERYMHSLLKFSHPLAYFRSRSRLRRGLDLFPEFRPLVARAILRRLATRARERYLDARCRLLTARQLRRSV